MSNVGRGFEKKLVQIVLIANGECDFSTHLFINLQHLNMPSILPVICMNDLLHTQKLSVQTQEILG